MGKESHMGGSGGRQRQEPSRGGSGGKGGSGAGGCRETKRRQDEARGVGQGWGVFPGAVGNG